MLGLLLADPVWARSACVARAELPLPRDDPAPWESLIRENQTAWKHIVRTAVHAEAQYNARVHLAAQVAARFFADATPAGAASRVRTDERGTTGAPVHLYMRLRTNARGVTTSSPDVAP